MQRTLRKLVGNESGTTAIEYAFIASLIAVAIVGALTQVGLSLQTPYQDVANAL